MPTELEELVEFLHHGNTQVRQAAVEHLVGLSHDASIFKKPQMLPVKDLTLLVRDYTPIAKNVFTILINISHDSEVLEYLAKDDQFIEELLRKITDMSDPTANEATMLLANLAKDDSVSSRLISHTRSKPKSSSISQSTSVLDQLMDCFVKGTNPRANFDYLSYFFADVSKHQAGRRYFVTRQPYDDVVPLTKLTVFTEHENEIRRRGVASTIKNVAFEVDCHPMLLSDSEANLLPYLLLPLAGNETDLGLDDDILSDLQLLPPDKTRDPQSDILVTHLETLLLLTTTRHGRDVLRSSGVYPVVRECHLHVDDDAVREACDRLVQVIMRDEAEENDDDSKTDTEKDKSQQQQQQQRQQAKKKLDDEEDEDEDEDNKMEEIF